ncbi:MAG: CHAP domain-containing protein [Bacteroidota bacterium]
MAVLKKGSTGPKVSELQLILQELGYDVKIDGEYGTGTYNAIRTFQAKHLDKHGKPLEVDGQVGDITWWALTNPRPIITIFDTTYDIMPDISFGGTGIGRAALQIAINEIKAGAREMGGNNMGPFCKKYLAPAGLGEGFSWCAAFVSWCFLQASGGDKASMPFKYNAGARNVYNQFKAKNWAHTDPNYIPKPGDIVAWWRVSQASGKGHIGIVHHYEDGFLYTIEGNKAANVTGFSYVKTRIDKLLGYGSVG